MAYAAPVAPQGEIVMRQCGGGACRAPVSVHRCLQDGDSLTDHGLPRLTLLLPLHLLINSLVAGSPVIQNPSFL